ncbi:MAG TPA: zinc-dependent alcohol dehydrogenase family protein [Myxococcota bacterium]|jgi:propanol-preferring alcohol dehydrogenase
MRAMSLLAPGPVESRPLAWIEKPAPEPASEEILVAVRVCGVCRTDLHLVEGDLAPRRAGIVPGHQVVGRVAACGSAARRFRTGDPVGVAWLRRACGVCRFCAGGRENLCLSPQFTGWDADGGFAEVVAVPEAFAYPLPAALDPVQTAPLLCAGIIGYRAYARSAVRPGGRLGLYGFGGSAHIVIQIARHHGCEVFVVTRGGVHRELAERLGAAWVGEAGQAPPVRLDGAILFAPAGELVPVALAALGRGGTLAVAGIHLSPIPPLDYQAHLFEERTLCSVTANTRADGEALLALAAEIPIRTHTQRYPLEAANQALLDLKQDRVRGTAVLEIGS